MYPITYYPYPNLTLTRPVIEAATKISPTALAVRGFFPAGVVLATAQTMEKA